MNTVFFDSKESITLKPENWKTERIRIKPHKVTAILKESILPLIILIAHLL